MKKLVTTVVLLAGAASVYSQGQVNTSDYNAGSFNIHIWSPNPAAPSVEQTGNSPATIAGNASYNANPDYPVGTAVYGGTLIGGGGTAPGGGGYGNGDNFDVELYAAAGTITTFSTSTFTAVSSLGSIDDAAFGSSFAGLYAGGGLLTLNGANGTITVAAGSPVTFAVAAWNNDGGTVGSYPAAVALGASGVYGVSTLGTENTGVNPNPPPFLPTAVNGGNPGISSFSLTSTIPEPSTISLGVIGASAFLMRLRRKK
jgi:hypothetical protein